MPMPPPLYAPVRRPFLLLTLLLLLQQPDAQEAEGLAGVHAPRVGVQQHELFHDLNGRCRRRRGRAVVDGRGFGEAGLWVGAYAMG